MRALTARKAFLKSLPVLGGYLILGMGFGILAGRAGYGILWVLAMSLLMFAGSMQFVGIGLLSGGEKVRLRLLLLLCEKPTMLLLDEPGNDLDLDAIRALEYFLLSCGLPVLYVSHDEEAGFCPCAMNRQSG